MAALLISIFMIIVSGYHKNVYDTFSDWGETECTMNDDQLITTSEGLNCTIMNYSNSPMKEPFLMINETVQCLTDGIEYCIMTIPSLEYIMNEERLYVIYMTIGIILLIITVLTTPFCIGYCEYGYW